MFDIPGAIAAVSTLVDDAVKRIWPDATEIEKAKIEQFKLEMQNQYNLILGQIEINKIEAASENWLTSGWRPYVGWVCGTGLLYSSLIEPLARFLCVVVFGYTGIFPVIDTTITSQVLMGMLGFGMLRSADKFVGIKK